jgi:hypothetical protein
MKIALLLSGLPRMVNPGYQKTWKRIIDNYDTDVYLHTWKDNSWGCEWEEVERVYNFSNVKSLHIQSPFKFTEYKTGISLPHTDKSRPLPEYDVMSCFRQLPMFYSWQKVYQDCYDSKVQYDCIIRSRYDMEIFYPSFMDAINLNVLNIGPGGQFFDDNLCISNQDNSNKVFHNIFDRLINKSRESGVLKSAEQTWTGLIDDSGCPAEVNHALHFRVLREDMVWWAE